eukprot:COSAG04_NODE_6575_length_1301_cov_1.621464_1_plen_96_part_00
MRLTSPRPLLGLLRAWAELPGLNCLLGLHAWAELPVGLARLPWAELPVHIRAADKANYRIPSALGRSTVTGNSAVAPPPGFEGAVANPATAAGDL